MVRTWALGFMTCLGLGLVSQGFCTCFESVSEIVSTMRSRCIRHLEE